MPPRVSRRSVMKRFVRTAAAAAIAASGSLGCMHTGGSTTSSTHGDGAKYRNWVDTCYPERYNAIARQETVAAFAPQVSNGHIMNQTVWNWYFEPGSDKLTPAGFAKLDSIAQVRPAPDSRIYLQAARDIAPTAENGDKLGELRTELTAKRAAAVQKYMNSQPAVNQVAYELFVHDAAVPGVPAEFGASSFRGQRQGYSGGLAAGGGTAALNTGSGGLQQPAQPTSNTNYNTNTNIGGDGGVGPSGGGAGPAGPAGPGPN